MTDFSEQVTFCATGKTGLGHLRRVATIARALSSLDARRPIQLVVNAPVTGLPEADLAVFDRIDIRPRDTMAEFVADGSGPVVVDTAVVPGIEDVARPLALILRETPADACSRFTLPAGRPWDLLLIPNPAEGWAPPPDTPPSVRAVWTGWVRRPPPQRESQARPRLLIASGGGGSPATAQAFAGMAAPIVAAVRRAAPDAEIIQNLGPRAPAVARVSGVDRVIHAGGGLDAAFASADLVISTAGYNSVLELAQLDTPALLAPVARTHDDQARRAADWGPLLGAAYTPEGAAEWAAETIAARRRRRPVDLGASGAEAAARAIRELVDGA